MWQGCEAADDEGAGQVLELEQVVRVLAGAVPWRAEQDLRALIANVTPDLLAPAAAIDLSNLQTLDLHVDFVRCPLPCLRGPAHAACAAGPPRTLALLARGSPLRGDGSESLTCVLPARRRQRRLSPARRVLAPSSTSIRIEDQKAGVRLLTARGGRWEVLRMRTKSWRETLSPRSAETKCAVASSVRFRSMGAYLAVWRRGLTLCSPSRSTCWLSMSSYALRMRPGTS